MFGASLFRPVHCSQVSVASACWEYLLASPWVSSEQPCSEGHAQIFQKSESDYWKEGFNISRSIIPFPAFCYTIKPGSEDDHKSK